MNNLPLPEQQNPETSRDILGSRVGELRAAQAAANEAFANMGIDGRYDDQATLRNLVKPSLAQLAAMSESQSTEALKTVQPADLAMDAESIRRQVAESYEGLIDA